MMSYSQDDIESILQTSYYDHRTDYVWKYIVGKTPELENKLYPIPDLDSFVVMHYMQKNRDKSMSEFLRDWKVMLHPGVIACTFSKRKSTLRIKARSYIYTYNTRLNQGLFVVNSEVADSIGLQRKVCLKRYRKSGMYKLVHLAELDEQLFSRYSERQKVKQWRESPQFDIDCKYCKEMIPFIMQEAGPKRNMLGYAQRLNVILSGNEDIRIGIIRDYSPKEMFAMPVFPRSEWKEGIRNAFVALEKEYAKEMEQRVIELQQWRDELSRITLKGSSIN